MSKIFISTNRDSAGVCFGRGEGNAKRRVADLLNISIDQPIQQILNDQVYIHLDFKNPEFEIDEENDYLLYHSQTVEAFYSKFKNKEFSNHPGKFKEVFEILIDDCVQDKFAAIKKAVFEENANSN
ncbi:hypothetical protein SAMN05421780_11338 [Flexibacter flexilis DSM 6793]|uniref:Uncharacterized protein n=1 Tax=Flexibacter flexilis DSM 6793 TaxID=927664 RepID=A0A1I1N7Z9_9BACT|nr:hypothetical protein [Flexibacter flexilis]SFC93844.1 hypothetical protein SAMN05421780_11338 [Flexibacter flexilis DSM 6793]